MRIVVVWCQVYVYNNWNLKKIEWTVALIMKMPVCFFHLKIWRWGNKAFWHIFGKRYFLFLFCMLQFWVIQVYFPKQSVYYLPEFGITRSLMGGTSFVWSMFLLWHFVCLWRQVVQLMVILETTLKKNCTVIFYF